MTGTVAGDSLDTTYTSNLSFQLSATQLLPSDGSPASAPTAGPKASGGPSSGLSQHQSGSVATPATTPNALTFRGISIEISLLRWIAVFGLLLSTATALYFYLRKRGEPFEETFHIQSKYGRMMVPIVDSEDLGSPPVDVPASSRRSGWPRRTAADPAQPFGDVDTYMLDEERLAVR